MILADKIIMLRKKNGWSQEELAEKLNVSRQSVSKWEGAQSIPDLDRILQMSKIFSVSTDYLLKDDIEAEQYVEVQEDSSLKRVSLEEANLFLNESKKSAPRIAMGVFMCVISPVIMFILGAAAESGMIGLSEDAAGGIGLIVLLILVAGAVAIFILSSSSTDDFKYLETEEFETEYGVDGMVSEAKKKYKDKYIRSNVIGTCICILAVIPIFAMALLKEENDFLGAVAMSTMLFLVAIGVYLFVRVGIVQGAMDRLLQEGDYSKQKKSRRKKLNWLITVYWLLAAGIFLAFAMGTNEWKYAGIYWAVAGILFAAIYSAASAFIKE